MRIQFLRDTQSLGGDQGTPGADLDRELAGRIIEGDAESLAGLLDRHLGQVYGYIQRRLGPGHDALAGEIAADTFSDALRHIKPYAVGTASTPMRLWLIRLAGTQIARRKQGHAHGTSRTGPESARLVRLRESMRSMPPRKEAILALALFEGMSAEELAAASGGSLPRAMRLLRSALKEAEET